MALTAAAGSISLAQECLRTSLANCAAFRTWVGAADVNAALAKIYHEALTPPSAAEYTSAEITALRPYAMISTQRFHYDLDAGGTSSSFTRKGALRLRFVDAVAALIATDEAEIGRRFLNNVGTVLEQLLTLAGTPGYLAIVGVAMDGPYVRTHPDDARDEGDAVFVDLELEWGPNG